MSPRLLFLATRLDRSLNRVRSRAAAIDRRDGFAPDTARTSDYHRPLAIIRAANGITPLARTPIA